MDRITAKYAEQQIARLARELGVKMHYTRQGREILTLTGGGHLGWHDRGLAEPAVYGDKGAWVLDASAANGWLNLYAYSEQGLGGLYGPLGHHAYKAAEWWEIAGFAADTLRFQREQVSA